MIGVSKSNEDTKTRLMEAAGEVFASRGFRAATIREICRRAGTNVGSVNYHFRDKLGLYSAVLDYSYKMAASKYPPDLGLLPGATPEEKLRAFILSFLLRLLAEGFPAWHGKLMAHEVMNPSEILAKVAENSIRPLFDYLAGIVRELLKEGGPPEQQESDAAFLTTTSIAGQCLYYYIGRHIITVIRPQKFDSLSIERIADHITRFSLGGIRELAGATPC